MAKEGETLGFPVQELAKSGEISVEKYIYAVEGINSPSASLLNVPQVDASLLSPSSSSDAQLQQLVKLRSALAYAGCFQLVNHGIQDSLIDKVREISQKFFALPLEDKRKCARTVEDTQGYGNDSVLSDNQILDWSDRLFLNVSPEDQIKLQFWPKTPADFRQVLEEYINKLKSLNEVILKAMAKSLDLEEDSFLNMYGDRATMIARFNHYPPCPRPDHILGVKPHADGSLLTFLLQDKQVKGLQLLKDEQWLSVPILPYAILVNVGDQAEIMSNGIFQSPVHRVVTNSTRERNTLAVFCIPAPDQEIGPAEQLIDENRPRLYKTLKAYVDLYFQNYQVGKRPIDAAKL